MGLTIFLTGAKLSKSSVIRQKWESQNGGNKKAKHAKFSEKRTFFTPRYAHVSGGKKCSFSQNLACFTFLLPPFWDSLFYLIADKITGEFSAMALHSYMIPFLTLR